MRVFKVAKIALRAVVHVCQSLQYAIEQVEADIVESSPSAVVPLRSTADLSAAIRDSPVAPGEFDDYGPNERSLP